MAIIVNYLYRKRRFKEDRSWPRGKIIRDLDKKLGGDVSDLLKDMVNMGIIGQAKKTLMSLCLTT